MVSTGVKAEKLESYVNIEDVVADRPSIDVTVSHHATKQRTVRLTTQGREVAELVLPGGTTKFTSSFPAVELENGVSTLRVEADADSDAYKYRLQQETLHERYPDLIESVYHRKENFGPTTIYVSLKERVNGELVVHQGNGVERRDINGSNLDITVLPTTPTEILGIAVNNRLGETVDETTHKLDLEKAENKTRVTEETSTAPDERSKPAVNPNSSSKHDQHNTSHSQNERVKAFTASSEEASTPYVSAAGLLATLGYCAYWMRERL